MKAPYTAGVEARSASTAVEREGDQRALIAQARVTSSRNPDNTPQGVGRAKETCRHDKEARLWTLRSGPTGATAPAAPVI